ncbi:hypothetical protein GGI19_006140 [Coemansia pectinata]|uniref:Uncharacterized protein n=1 Tax=Coemansia pectinata TaxID=1052879 RepID=A0A9W8GUP8_9FUNG|nr:hypothetical protein GGI19_006140 [Coemansia pectinata]
MGYQGSVNKYLGHPTHRLARDLDIELDEVDVYSGTTLRMLSCEPYDGCAFLLVHKITVIVFLGDNIKTKHSVVMANISAFVQRIKQMAPMAKDFLLRPMVHSGVNHTTGHYFNDLATQLFQIAERIEIGLTDALSFIQGLQLNGVRNLVRKGMQLGMVLAR